MSCGKVSEKLWNQYLSKYGDFRERLNMIRSGHQCLTQFQLSKLKRQSFSVHQRTQYSNSVKTNYNQRVQRQECQSILPVECCRNDQLTVPLSLADRKNLERLMQDETFPDNIFAINTQSRPSIEDDVEIKESVRPSDSRLAATTVHRSNASRYKQLLDQFRKLDKRNGVTPDSQINESLIEPKINENVPVQNFLSFLHSLDDSNTLDENILTSLFSVDNYLSASIYLPTNIHPFSPVPKTILDSLNNQEILKRIENEVSSDKLKPLRNEQPVATYDSQYTDQDNELNSKLCNTYALKVFREFLLHRHPSRRLPKLFHDIDQWQKKVT
ncbi:unnamed protein product [Adineta ricciae]|uniref:Uncharacterized protein n=1 Tax=Adineta ricciae TaxID=249248 RepID=A0A814QFP5_ADIRI|nr:unnamed protein product [Adineta ricciae]